MNNDHCCIDYNTNDHCFKIYYNFYKKNITPINFDILDHSR